MKAYRLHAPHPTPVREARSDLQFRILVFVRCNPGCSIYRVHKEVGTAYEYSTRKAVRKLVQRGALFNEDYRN